MKLPRALLRHRILVEPHLGASGRGPVYGPPVEVCCHLAPSTVQLDRGGQGDRTRRAATTAYLDIAHRDLVTAQARVTVDGRVVEVVAVRAHTHPGSPTPDHLEVQFV